MFASRIGDARNGRRFGDLSLRLAEQFDVDAWTGRVSTIYFSVIFSCNNPLREAVGPLDEARKVALNCGDIEFAMLNAVFSCVLQLDILPIPELIESIREYQETMKTYGQKLNLRQVDPSLWILLSCSGQKHGDISVLEEASERIVSEQRNPGVSSSLVVQWLNYAKSLVAFLFGRPDEAMCFTKLYKTIADYPSGCGDCCMSCLVFCLILCQKLRENRWNLVLLLECNRRIRALRGWAAKSPFNNLGKVHLLEAEVASILGRNDRAHLKYVSSISIASQSGFYLQTALANELAGKHFLRLKDRAMATTYLEEAEKVYRSWGGHAKADHLAAEVGLKCSNNKTHSRWHL